MPQVEKNVAPHKSDDAKGENTAHTELNREADAMAKKASKTEKDYDQKNPIFTK